VNQDHQKLRSLIRNYVAAIDRQVADLESSLSKLAGEEKNGSEQATHDEKSE